MYQRFIFTLVYRIYLAITCWLFKGKICLSFLALAENFELNIFIQPWFRSGFIQELMGKRTRPTITSREENRGKPIIAMILNTPITSQHKRLDSITPPNLATSFTTVIVPEAFTPVDLLTVFRIQIYDITRNTNTNELQINMLIRNSNGSELPNTYMRCSSY